MVDKFIPTPPVQVEQNLKMAFGQDFRLEQSAASLPEIEDLKHRYSSLLIQLDRLRPIVASADVLYRHEGDEWSIKEILGHLIDADRVIWWPRINAILEASYASDGSSTQPFFEDIDQIDLVRRHHWQTIPIEDVFGQLMRVRWEYAMQLNQLPSSAFTLQGEHSTAGVLTIFQIAQILVAHDAHYLEKVLDIVEVTGKTPTSG